MEDNEDSSVQVFYDRRRKKYMNFDGDEVKEAHQPPPNRISGASCFDIGEHSNDFETDKNNSNNGAKINNNKQKAVYLKMNHIEVDKNKQQQQTKLVIEETEIFFPYEPYPQQIDYMKSVLQALNGKGNALLQSPTGTGKTLCLLCASLGWLKRKRMQQKIDNEKSPVRIVYSSRTHSQLQQVVRELKATIYRPKMTVLASRDQYCLKKEFELLSGSHKITACQKSIKGDDPTGVCGFFRGHHDDEQVEFSNEIMDIEDLKVKGDCDKFCPYFYSRRYKDAVDLLFLPYNYLLDQSGLSPFNIDLTNAVLIFDEAHNVHKVSEDGSSLALTSFHLDAFEREINIIRQLHADFVDPNKFRKLNERKKNKIKQLGEIDTQGLRTSESICSHLLSVSKSLRNWMQKEIAAHEQNYSTVYSGSQIFKILSEHTKYDPKLHETTHPADADQLNLNQFGYGFRPQNQPQQSAATASDSTAINPFLDGLNITNIDKYIDYLGKCIEDVSTSQNFGCDQMSVFLKLVKVLLANDLAYNHKGGRSNQDTNFTDNLINNYKLLVDINVQKQQYDLFLQCLDPSQSFMRLREKNPYNIIFTSGTLSPFDSWSAELKMSFPQQLSNAHVINTSESLLAGILTKGPLGNELVFDYNNRGNQGLIDDLGLTILNLVKYIPNGVLVIFNSNSSFEVCRNRWIHGELNIMKQLQELKHIIFEPQSSSELNTVMNKYTQQAKSAKGAILFAVCRGKISEGIDFSDELARAVFIVGVPYPPVKEPRVTNKKAYLDSIWNDRGIQGDKISGNQWYLQQAIRAMNQAIGRVIRHKNDWGAVFLCDSRFKQPNVKNEISDWVKAGNGLKEYDNFPSALIETMSFFKSKPKTVGNQKKKLLAASKNSLASRQTSNQSEQSTHNSKKIPLKKPFNVPTAEQHKRPANQDTKSGNPFEKLIGQKQMKMTDFKTTKVAIKTHELSSVIEQPICDDNNNNLEDTQFLEEIQQYSQQQQPLQSVEREYSENSCGAFNKQFLKSEEGVAQTAENLEELKIDSQPSKNKLSNLRKVQSKNIQNLILKQNQLRKEEEEKQQTSQDRIFLKSKGTTTSQSEIHSSYKGLLSEDSSFDDEQQENQKTVETNPQYPSDLQEEDEFKEKEDNNQKINPYLYQKQGKINLFGQKNGQDQLERDNYFNPEPKVKLQIGQNYMHTPRSSLLKSPFQINQNNNSNGSDFLFQENSNSGQLGQYGNSNFRDQQKEQQQQDSFDNNSKNQQKFQVYQYTLNKPQVSQPANKSLGINRQGGTSLSGLQKPMYSIDKQTSSNPKANEPCCICRRIPAERVMNKNCNHIGCLSCFMKNKACSCGEKCTKKDLQVV